MKMAALFFQKTIALSDSIHYNNKSYPKVRVCGCKSMPVAGETIHISGARPP